MSDFDFGIEEDKMLTMEDLAAFFGVHVETIRRHVRNGAIEAIHFGRCLRVSQEEFERLKREGL